MRYAFNKDAAVYGEALGIPEDRIRQIQKETKAMALRAVITDPEIDRDTDAFEILLNELDPQTIVEAILIGRLYGGYFEKTKEGAKRLRKALK